VTFIFIFIFFLVIVIVIVIVFFLVLVLVFFLVLVLVFFLVLFFFFLPVCAAVSKIRIILGPCPIKHFQEGIVRQKATFSLSAYVFFLHIDIMFGLIFKDTRVKLNIRACSFH